jgi:hypothetical protein
MILRPAALLLSLTMAANCAQPESQKLAFAAAEASNIFATGKPLRLRAHITVRTKTEATGDYALMTNGPDSWRDEITIAGYQEARIGTADSIYRQASSKDLDDDYFARKVRSLLNIPGMLFDAGSRTSSKPKKKKIDGRELTCFDTQFEETTGSTYCFDPDLRLGAVKNIYFDDSMRKGNFETEPVGVVLSDFLTFRDKWYPRHITFRSNIVTITAEITSIDDIEPLEKALLQPDSTFNKEDGCLLPKPPLFVRLGWRPSVAFPTGVSQPEATTVHYTIGADGTVRDAQSSASKNFLRLESENYVRGLVYRPAQCNGHPIASRRSLDLIFVPGSGLGGSGNSIYVRPR